MRYDNSEGSRLGSCLNFGGDSGRPGVTRRVSLPSRRILDPIETQGLLNVGPSDATGKKGL